MKPFEAIDKHRDAVRTATTCFNASNPRTFGFIANGTDCKDSDVDILVDPQPGATLFELGCLLEALEALEVLLGFPVDLCTPGDFPPGIRARVLAEARPILIDARALKRRIAAADRWTFPSQDDGDA